MDVGPTSRSPTPTPSGPRLLDFSLRLFLVASRLPLAEWRTSDAFSDLRRKNTRPVFLGTSFPAKTERTAEKAEQSSRWGGGVGVEGGGGFRRACRAVTSLVPIHSHVQIRAARLKSGSRRLVRLRGLILGNQLQFDNVWWKLDQSALGFDLSESLGGSRAAGGETRVHRVHWRLRLRTKVFRTGDVDARCLKPRTGTNLL